MEDLKRENLRLTEENLKLRKHLEAFCALGRIDVAVSSKEVNLHKASLKGDTILQQYEELLALRKKCVAYEKAIAQTKEHMSEMSKVFAKIAEQQQQLEK